MPEWLRSCSGSNDDIPATLHHHPRDPEPGRRDRTGLIHPFADGNGRMGRLWQSLILARWNPLFADIPVESLILEHQAEYYQAIQESTETSDSAPFIAFMLRMILETVTSSTPEVTQEVTPEVRLLSVLVGEMTRQQLKQALGLKDDEHFRKAYLLPALDAGLIEMTIPDKPRSSKQKYRRTDKGKSLILVRLRSRA